VLFRKVARVSKAEICATPALTGISGPIRTWMPFGFPFEGESGSLKTMSSVIASSSARAVPIAIRDADSPASRRNCLRKMPVVTSFSPIVRRQDRRAVATFCRNTVVPRLPTTRESRISLPLASRNTIFRTLCRLASSSP
jgi:hypothetical protein